MLYLLPGLTIAMLGYLAWAAIFRLRRDRVFSQREHTRGKFTFAPKERIRFLLNRSFQVPEEKPEWEEPIVSALKSAPAADPAPQVDDRTSGSLKQE